MSTPSTATATHASHHPHYGYSHHQVPYQTNGAYPPNSTAGSTRLANNYAYSANTATSAPTQPPQPHPPAAKPAPSSSVTNKLPSYNTSASSGSMSSGPSGRRRKPDWGEFYKNGLPTEVIVIDDSPPPDQHTTASRTHAPSSTVTVINQANGGQPAGKKRRTGVETAYDLSYFDRPSYSMNPQKYGEHSSAGSLSTDRTTSLHTTAPTSLGSHASTGTSNGVHYEDANIGQKRKRVTTRKSTRDEQKRRELETAGDAFLNYIPPPQPPVKAKDVPVPVIRDVRESYAGLDPLLAVLTAFFLQYSYSRHQKVDDDDGHYIVTPETELTDRCTSPIRHNRTV